MRKQQGLNCIRQRGFCFASDESAYTLQDDALLGAR